MQKALETSLSISQLLCSLWETDPNNQTTYVFKAYLLNNALDKVKELQDTIEAEIKKITDERFHYEVLLRPASFASLPLGVNWDYVEVPIELAGKFIDKPIAKNRHGIISTSRKLTVEELSAFDLRAIKKDI